MVLSQCGEQINKLFPNCSCLGFKTSLGTHKKEFFLHVYCLEIKFISMSKVCTCARTRFETEAKSN